MNLDALDRPVSKAEAQDFLDRHPVKRMFFHVSGDVASAAALFAILGYVLVSVISNANIVIGLVFVGIAAFFMIVAVLLYFYYHHVYALKNAEIGLRVERMAENNGWLYQHRVLGMMKPQTTFFNTGKEYEFTNVVKATDFEAGQFQYKVDSGRNEKTVRSGYMIIPLQRHMTHMLLDGKSNNLRIFGIEVSNLPATMQKNQIDVLEGDFSDHYVLYAPEGYNVDTRYVFTPDLMHILVEESDSIDIEILDDNVYVYFGKYDVHSKAFWQKVERLKDAFNDKLLPKTARYEDDSTLDGSVAPEAKRLKKAVPVITLVAASIVVLSNVVEIVRFIRSMF